MKHISKTESRGTKQLNVEVPRELYRRIRREALERESSIRIIVNQAIAEFFGVAEQIIDRERL